jgi:transcriptional antiterminator Rof (Rho-off)
MDSEYKPVACQLYDELGLRMLRNTVCELVLDGEEGSETVRTVIRDLFTDGDAEYVLLDSGRRIRLDRIQRVEDVESSAG